MTPQESQAFAAAQLKADMFDYLCWLEDYDVFRQAALDGKAGDYLLMAKMLPDSEWEAYARPMLKAISL